MSRTLIYRQDRMFKIDHDQLPDAAKLPSVVNGLYADIYTEFSNAHYNPKYSTMSLLERMQAVNEYAQKWLTDKGFS